MKPKAPKKRNPKPNCKSGEVKNENPLIGFKFIKAVWVSTDPNNFECKLQYSNDYKTWID